MFKTIFRFTMIHCKLTRRRRSNSIYITVTTLWPRCFSMSDLTRKCKKGKFIYLHIINSKHFCSTQYLFNKRFMIKNIFDFNVMYILLQLDVDIYLYSKVMQIWPSPFLSSLQVEKIYRWNIKCTLKDIFESTIY